MLISTHAVMVCCISKLLLYQLDCYLVAALSPVILALPPPLEHSLLLPSDPLTDDPLLVMFGAMANSFLLRLLFVMAVCCY